MSKLIRLTKKVPQLFTAKKIEPTLSGNNTLLVRKREFDISGIVTTRNDSSNIFKKKITEKYKKINVQSRKKIETDKKKEIKSFENSKPKSVPKPKPKASTLQSPRNEVKIITVKKRHKYLDNYQYHETVVLKRKKPSFVEHRRLDSLFIINDESSYMRLLYPDENEGVQVPKLASTISTTERNKPRIQVKKLAITSNDFYKKNTLFKSDTNNKRLKIKPESTIKQLTSRGNTNYKTIDSLTNRIEVNKSHNYILKKKHQIPKNNIKINIKEILLKKNDNKTKKMFKKLWFKKEGI
jgi:hypothetical protein